MDAERQAFWLLKDINRAIRDFSMIEDGDRVAVAVSGGKDSLSLLRLLDLNRRSAPVHYELAAVHVPADGDGPQGEAHPPLAAWLAASGIPTVIARLELPVGEPLPMDCHRCTWNRRRVMFQAAQELGCRVVAFGHHADDLAQTTLLNLIFHGRVETMAPRRDLFDGALRVVRPLCYMAEKDLRRFARANEYPAPPPDCSQSGHSRRRLARDLLLQVGRAARDGGAMARANLLRAGLEGLEKEDR